MAEFGAQLRKAREDRGISLLEAEEATRIRRVFLQAIEENRFDDLPGEVYGRGFVQSYARYLGLDPEPLLREYPHSAAHEPLSFPQILDEPLTPLTHRLTRWLVILLLLGGLAAGGWYLYETYWVEQGYRVQSLWPPRVGPLTAPTAEAPEPSSTQPVAIQGATPPQGATQAVPSTGTQPTAMPFPTATATARPPTPTPTRTPTPWVGVNLEVTAQADTYLEIRADDELIWIGILSAGESAEWSADELMEMRIGNAGGIQVWVNGRNVGPLGESGEVVNVTYRASELP